MGLSPIFLFSFQKPPHCVFYIFGCDLSFELWSFLFSSLVPLSSIFHLFICLWINLLDIHHRLSFYLGYFWAKWKLFKCPIFMRKEVGIVKSTTTKLAFKKTKRAYNKSNGTKKSMCILPNYNWNLEWLIFHSQCVPQRVSNSSSFYAHVFCPKFYSCNLYKHAKGRDHNISILGLFKAWY
jgi:hypothetical protein